MPYLEESYDIVVVGAGHAGCEAALACARLGLETIMFTVSVDSIALMPCNPNVGGSSKGHLVRELDALGGEMGRAADATMLQSRMLNRGKGPAVHSLRVQSDRMAYHRYMKEKVESTPGRYRWTKGAGWPPSPQPWGDGMRSKPLSSPPGPIWEAGSLWGNSPRKAALTAPTPPGS